MITENNKGFTLIELLAIIVILAIIAVITVPIILNVIDNSRVGAAQDSAYGYKDAINKYYVSELYENLDLKLDGTYTITDKGRLSNETGIHEIPFTGTTPTGGYLNYENNVLKDGCITIEEYKVTIENGEIITTEKGNCTSISNTPVEEEIPDPVIVSCSDSNYVPTDENFFLFNPTMQAITGFDTNNYDGSTDIKIPCTIGGTTVTTIYYGAFSGKQLTSVVIPDNITTIYDGAFNNNKLVSVAIPGSVTTIGNSSFSINELKKIKLSEGIETIGSAAFATNKLKNVEIPNSVKTINGAAFNDNQFAEEIAYIYARNNGVIDNTKIVSYGGTNTELTISSNIVTIGDQAFTSCNLTKITIPESVTTIGASAFLDNDLTTITIPNSVTTIGASAFANNTLETVTLGTNVTTIGNYAFRKFKNANITSNINLTTIYNNAGKAFNWGLIINSATSGYDFEVGTVENDLGSIVVQKSI